MFSFVCWGGCWKHSSLHKALTLSIPSSCLSEEAAALRESVSL